MGSLPPEFLLLIIALVFGLAGGLGVWLFRYASGKRKQKPSQATSSSTAIAETSPEDGKELLRVSRTKAGALVIFVQGQQYHHLRGITDPRTSHETVEAINAVHAFGEGSLPAFQPASPQAIPQPPTSAIPTVDRRAPVREPRKPFASSLSPEKPSGHGTAVRQPGQLLDPLTFVDDIDRLVKQRIQERQDMAERFIHMEAGPGGGLRIYVDQEVFQAVGDVTDPQVRALIQEAIREWEGV